MKNDKNGKKYNIIRSLFTTKRRGSALAAVLIVCTCVAMVAGTAMQLSTSERRMNHYAALNAEARNAAEAIAEYGLADLTYRFNTQNSFASDALKRTKTPLKLPSSFFTVFANSNVVMPGNPYDATVTHDTEIVGGSIPDAGMTFINASIPGNESDVLADRNVIIRQVRVYGKATVRDAGGTTVTARYRRSLQVRDAPLFSYAIFYNMPLEFVVGPAMEVTGPVHTNSDLYLECDNSLTFYDKVTAVGKIRHDLRRNSAGTLVYGSETVGSGTISFYDKNGTKTSMKSGSTWIDSNYSDWYKTSLKLWGGNVQDAAYSVRACKSVAFDSYVEDNPETTTVNEMRDYAYQMIMPLDTSASANATVEKQKYAYKAGLVIIVSTGTTGITTFSLYAQKFDAQGNLVYSGTTPSRTFLCTYTPVTINSDTEIKANLSAIFKITNCTYSGSTLTSGMFDARRGAGIDLLEVDMNKLRSALEKNDARDWANTSSSTDATYRPQTWWNGIIYFQFPYDTSDVKGADGVVMSVDNFGVRLYDAAATLVGTTYTPGIPHPTWSQETGTTIATNNTMYIKGHYNADGDKTNTGSNTAVDDVNEPAASLVADSITFLSSNWNDANSQKSLSYRVASSFTEISAAVVSGIVPTNSDGKKCRSGAVNNFPRFLEDFNNQTLRYRGSMVVLYQSEVGNENFTTSTYYNPPIRNWGFNVMFANGIFPPGTPNIRTYKRVDSKYLSEGEWATETNSLN
jgi:hypothetical protein